MELDDLIDSSLREPHMVVGYALSRRLHALFPDMAIIHGTMPMFNVQAYAQAGLCTMTARDSPYPMWITYWAGPEHGNLDRPYQAMFDVRWEDEALTVLIVHWGGDHEQYHYFLLARSDEVARLFHRTVCMFNTQVADDELLVFDVNGWNKDELLFAAIKNATLDALVLRGSLKEDILSDVMRFFGARETYAEYNVPWKRGVLFVGPAGNGKTHAIKALINVLGETCIYVRTFGGGGPGDQMAIREIFGRARMVAPCVMVLEDLDSLITPQNRSYFLNELDGFAGNDGLLTLATTNHPERLDPAIVDRPSRFDRKYPFDLPELEERQRYIDQWNGGLREALRLSPEAIGRLAEETAEFSFAYLKELFLSSTMRWIESAGARSMDEVMEEQAPVLREQMASVVELTSDPGYGISMPMMGHHRPAMHHMGNYRPHGQGPDEIPL
jgi:AAA+ superfamily predicted ATPase